MLPAPLVWQSICLGLFSSGNFIICWTRGVMNHMRLDEILKQQAIQESQQSKGRQSAGADDAFALLLQSEMSGSGTQAVSDDAVCGTDDLSGALGIQASIANAVQTPELSQALSAIDGAVTQLDSLSDALQQNKSPKEIDALIEQVNAQAAGLDDKLSGLPSDHQLKDMAEEFKVTAYMESLKWKRGDYL